MRATFVRALALAIGGFSLANLAGSALREGFDATLWMYDLRSVPRFASVALTAITAVLLLDLCFRPELGPARRRLTRGLLWALTLVALVNSATFFSAWSNGAIAPSFPLPLSILFAGATFWMERSLPLALPAERRRWPRTIAIAGLAGLCASGFLVAQMLAFGGTDYRRPADAIVVFGARVYADGEPSRALEDRVRTGVALYHEGLAPTLLFSGGPGDGETHEVEAMRDLAVELGVPAEATRLDYDGVNTHGTVTNSADLAGALGWDSILAVSHGYHLPRIKLSFQRANLTAYTVPVQDGRTLHRLPYYMLREVAALGWYYVRPL